MPIEDKPQIIFALNEKIDAFNNYIEPLSKEQFEATPNGKWSAAQNLDHLFLLKTDKRWDKRSACFAPCSKFCFVFCYQLIIGSGRPIGFTKQDQ